MTFTISAFSTALYSNWYYVKELRALFDAGDGIVSNLLGKTGSIRNVFLSHADRDHLTGLLQLNQLNARPGLPRIMYPKDAQSIRVFELFSKQFDRQVQQTCWVPVDEETAIHLNERIQVNAIRNNHVRAPANVLKSVGYLVYESRQKLKQGFHGKTADELIMIKSEMKESVTETVQFKLFAYSGDCPVENFSAWNGAQVLIHESTFLYKHELADVDERYNLHSTAEEVIAAAAGIQLGCLVLSHFSSRYKASEIDEVIRGFCRMYALAFPVYRLLPGIFYPDVLAPGSGARIW